MVMKFHWSLVRLRLVRCFFGRGSGAILPCSCPYSPAAVANVALLGARAPIMLNRSGSLGLQSGNGGRATSAAHTQTRKSPAFVDCPMCHGRVPYSIINVHIDSCTGASSPSVASSRPPVDSTKPSSITAGVKRPRPADASPADRRVAQRVRKAAAPATRPALQARGSPDNGHSPAAATGAGSGKQPRPRSTAASRARPLADRMRPSTLAELVGQTKAFGPSTALRLLIAKDTFPSLILWGPPGCGKTTVAGIIAKATTRIFRKLSAVTAGVKDVRAVVDRARNSLTLHSRRTVLFVDEIHRFNKAQQDAFLPHVESGLITLVGATTENPSFSLNSALLSRCRVVVLEKLGEECVEQVLQRAAADTHAGLGTWPVRLPSGTAR